MRERGNKIYRFIDRYIGIPLIFLLGVMRFSHKGCVEHLRLGTKFILIKTAGIGDTILLSGIIGEIRNNNPSADITVICANGNFAAAKMLDVNHIEMFDLSSPIKSLWGIRRLSSFDYLFDFAPWAKINSVISYVAKAYIKIGFKRQRMYRHYVYDYYVEHSDTLHELDNYRALLKKAGLSIHGVKPILELEKLRLNDVSVRFYKYIVFHAFPGGSHSTLREWPVESWTRLGKQLIDDGYNIILSGGKEDIERATFLQKCIDPDGERCISIAGEKSLADMAGVLNKTLLLITVQTGIMHMGATLGVPLIALHGPTSPIRWGPVSENAVVIKPNLPCAPCLSLGSEYGCKSGDCMKAISEHDVYAAAIATLNNHKRRNGDVRN